jgi:hypothetical protein
MGVASRVADYAQKPALHEGRGMVAGRDINVRPRKGFLGIVIDRAKSTQRVACFVRCALLHARRATLGTL